KVPPKTHADRASPEQQERLQKLLRDAGVEFQNGAHVDKKLAELRAMYDPFLSALSRRFLLPLPPMASAQDAADNWQRSAWMRPAPGIGALPDAVANEDHF